MKRVIFTVAFMLLVSNSFAAQKKAGKTIISDTKFSISFVEDKLVKVDEEVGAVEFIAEAVFKSGMAKRQFPLNKRLWLTKTIVSRHAIMCESMLLMTTEIEYLTADDVRVGYSNRITMDKIAPGSAIAVMADYYCDAYYDKAFAKKFAEKENKGVPAVTPMEGDEKIYEVEINVEE